MSMLKQYLKYKEESLAGLWITYQNVKELILALNDTIFTQKIIGYSENDNPIHSIQVGTGSIKILLWSQMHGDESTATKSLFDVFNFIADSYKTNNDLVNLLKKCTLLFIPMLNPDGALAYTRENAHGIDLNRDAQSLKSLEAQLLMKIATDFKPNFAFNLHDQTRFYNITTTDVATLSFLAPASDVNRVITASRREAMSVIATMYIALQDYLPNKIGRYNDTFNVNCFGDSFQLLDYPTILIESGYFPGDENREETRKFHFIALMSGLFAIADHLKVDYSLYFDIPMNQKLYYDLRIDNVIYNTIVTSVAIRFKHILKDAILHKEIDFSETISGDELQGKIFHKTMNANGKALSDIQF